MSKTSPPSAPLRYLQEQYIIPVAGAVGLSVDRLRRTMSPTRMIQSGFMAGIHSISR
jgi:hypothetical protein